MELTPVFKLIEYEDKDEDDSDIPFEVVKLRQLIRECGVSQTTLEEVFMKVTGKKEGKKRDADGKKFSNEDGEAATIRVNDD